MPSRPRSRTTGLLRRAAAMAMVAVGIGTLSGMADDGAVARNEARVGELERTMPLGPRSAGTLGLRIAWRQPIAVGTIVGVFISNGGAFLVDADNEVTMFDLDTGEQRWVGFGAGGNDIIIDILHVPDEHKVLVIRTNSILSLSADTGIPLIHGATRTSVQPLEWLAATPGTLRGGSYIYGGLAGEVVWQGWELGFSTRAHRIGRRVASQPVIAGNAVIAASRSGTLAALDVDTGRLLWQTQLLDGISGLPATSSSLVFVASRDQHIRGYDALNGKLKWARLFQTPLTSGPTLYGNAVYQQVPDTGLIRFEAAPRSAPSGIEVWTAPEVKGDVIGTTGDLLLTWTPESKVIQTVSSSTGSVDATIETNNVLLMKAKDNTLLLLGGDGELECLRPALGK